ncbi:hypothetical protein AB0P37_08435 [Streptomyces antimycoticus]|uniref:hypothetical protein n=1 Tax=Streptomyces antimycoticus TaxID=68175 RepID=UPI00342E5E2C
MGKDDRRERYAAAIDDTFVYSTDFDAERAADAAMAVADEEQRTIQARYNRTARENARLRAEAGRLRDEVTRLERRTPGYVRDENIRVRIELAEARATIERVRAVLDVWDAQGPAYSGIVAVLRGEINTPRTVANPDRTRVTE